MQTCNKTGESVELSTHSTLNPKGRAGEPESRTIMLSLSQYSLKVGDREDIANYGAKRVILLFDLSYNGVYLIY